MNSKYIIHDDQYKALKESGFDGWGAQALEERVAGFKRDFTRLMSSKHCPKPPSKVLEIGCGAGNMTEIMASFGYRLTGVDISQTAVFWAQERAQKNQFTAEFVCQDIRDMKSLPSASFDLVVDTACFHCIIGKEDRSRAFQEMARLLKREGKFFISSMVGEPRELNEDRNYNPADRCQYHSGVPYRYMPLLEDLERELTQHGFFVEEKWLNKNRWWDHYNGILSFRN